MSIGTIRKLTQQWSQKHHDRYVQQNIRSMTKARDKGHRDFKHWTDAEIVQAAQRLARVNNAGLIYT